MCLHVRWFGWCSVVLLVLCSVLWPCDCVCCVWFACVVVRVGGCVICLCARVCLRFFVLAFLVAVFGLHLTGASVRCRLPARVAVCCCLPSSVGAVRCRPPAVWAVCCQLLVDEGTHLPHTIVCLCLHFPAGSASRAPQSGLQPEAQHAQQHARMRRAVPTFLGPLPLRQGGGNMY